MLNFIILVNKLPKVIIDRIVSRMASSLGHFRIILERYELIVLAQNVT